jgi:hypothetical protein
MSVTKIPQWRYPSLRHKLPQHLSCVVDWARLNLQVVAFFVVPFSEAVRRRVPLLCERTERE